MNTCFFTPETETPVQEAAAFFQMGRFGDLILLLPAFKEWAERTGQPTIVVTSKQFGTVLEGASYVEPVFMDFDWHARAGEALALAKQRFPKIVRTQNHGNGWHTEPDNLPSYSISSWARAGLTLEDYKRLALVFDQRSEEREALLVRTWKRSSKPLLLVCFDAVTSPLPAAQMSMMVRAMAPMWKHFEVVNTNEVRAHRLYDLLGLMDVAAGLVTLDTAPLHLAAASNVPVLNYVRDDGQARSIPKNNAFATIGYSKVEEEIPKMLSVLGGWATQNNPTPIKTIARETEPVTSKPGFQPTVASKRKYMIGTGYYEKPGTPRSEFFSIWFENTMQHAKPERVVVLANGGSKIDGAPGQWIEMTGNLGHAHDLNEHRKPHVMCGWSAAFVTLAMLAYFDECDFIFKEQDALAFGPWVERLYEEIGSRGMVFGDNKEFACSQSLVLIKHEFIPEFVQLYMGQGSEQQKRNECEIKFQRLQAAHPDKFGRFSFGCDRDRPIPYDADVFYAQQLSAEELAEMKRRGLI